MRFAALLVLGTALSAGLAAAGTLIGSAPTYNASGSLGANSYSGNVGAAGYSGSAGAGNAGAGYSGAFGSTPNLPGTGVMPSELRSRSFPTGGLNMNALNSRAMAKIRSLRHHWAVGVDSVPAAAIAAGSNSMVAVPNALSVRWWATERLGVDLLAGGNYNSAQAGRGELSPLVSSGPGSAVYAGGLGFHYNVAALSHDLLSQIVVKASGAQSTQDISVNGTSGRADATTLAVFVGAGFEAFIPGWDWLSVEGSAGLTGFSQSLTPQGAGSGGPQTVSGLGLAGSAYSPVNLAVHAYF
jgi:hypothetical protein